MMSGEACSISIEECLPTSAVIVLDFEDKLLNDFLGCRLWHRTSTTDYPEQPTFIVLKLQKRFKLENLLPSTEYFCKASVFSYIGILAATEAKWVTPCEPEKVNITTENHQVEPANSCLKLSSGVSFKEFLARPLPVAPFVHKNSIAVSPSTLKDHGYKHSVTIIKSLDREHIDETFRSKFLAWFSQKATQKERRVVSAFVDALMDDPASLVEQLLHTFSCEICSDQKP